jgi:hypothetical protein
VSFSDLLGYYPDLVRKGVFKGVNLVPLVERFWRLPSICAGLHNNAVPQVTWHSANRGGAHGIAYYDNTMRIRLAPDASIDEAVEVVLHEVIHCSFPRGVGHKRPFCQRLIACAKEAFGLELDEVQLLKLCPGDHGRVAYAIDAAIIGVMRKAYVGRRMREEQGR